MGKLLSDRQVGDYHEQGYVCPVRVMSEIEARGYRRRLEDFEASRGRKLQGLEMHKSYLIFTWFDELVRHTRVLDGVEDLIGPDILVFSSSLFVKEPKDHRFISWHQDSTYWNFEPVDVVTAWVALSASRPENGCLRIAPKSHLRRQLPHVETEAPDNMLTRGQEIAVGIDETTAVEVVLKPGEMSLHHALAAHASGPNPTDDRRIGFAIRFIPTRVRQVAGPTLTAMLVRGTDSYQHFEAERSPSRDLEPVALAFFEATMERHRAEKYSTV
jgi:hypothetical protein